MSLTRSHLLAAYVVGLVVVVAVFWSPLFIKLRHGDFGSSYYDYGSSSTDFVDTYYQPTAEALKKLSTLNERRLLDEIYADLRKRPNAELSQLYAFPEMCAAELVNCRGLVDSKVKPFITAILSDRASAVTAIYYDQAVLVASRSMLISFFALLFSALTFFLRRPPQPNKQEA